MDTTRKGKIARLPLAIREDVNFRLLNNETASKILPWLNALPAVKELLEEDFEGLAVNDQNLSDWRKGGFQDWCRRRDRLEHTREMAAWSMKMAKAGGGNLTEGAAAVLSGRVLEVLENLDELVSQAEPGAGGESDKMELIAKAIDGLTLSIARLRKGDHNAAQLKLNRERLDQSAEQLKLEREKFVMLTCGKFLDVAKLDKVREIATSDRSNAEKIAALREAYFSDVDALEKSGEVKIPE